MNNEQSRNNVQLVNLIVPNQKFYAECILAAESFILFFMKLNICSIGTGASTYMVFRGKSGIEKVFFSEFWQFWKPLIFLFISSMKKFLKLFANGRGNFPLSNMLEFLFFPSKMFI